MVLVYDVLFPALSEAERDAYCAEAAWVACALGAREADVPRTWPALGLAMRSVHDSGVLVVGGDARQVAAGVIAPPFGPLAYPLSATVRLVTRAWLPEGIRAQYGLAWTAADARRLPLVLGAMRATRRMLPARAARWPESRM
jgi:uncharacterized protein (DUF2236 family)